MNEKLKSYLHKLRGKYARVERTAADLKPYQVQAVEFLRNTPRAALFIDTGLGKTAICLKLIRDLLDADEIQNVLIIAPLKVANQTWGDEIGVWDFSAPIPYKLLRADNVVESVNAAGRASKRQPLDDKELAKIERKTNQAIEKMARQNPYSEAQLAEMRQSIHEGYTADYIKHRAALSRRDAAARALAEYDKIKPAKIHIINQEMVEWLVEARGDNWIYDCVIFDESDALKDASTKRWKALDSIKHLTTRFYELTATPTAESYLGLFAQIKLLDGGERLGRTKTEFLERYFDVNRYNYKTTLKEGADKRMIDAIADICLIMKQADYLPDLANYEIENVLYDLPDDARALYRDMSKTGSLIIQDTQIAAETAVAVLQKLLQISAGFVYDSQDDLRTMATSSKSRTIYPIHTAKIEALKNLMARFPNENFLISYYHQGSLELLKQHFPKAVKMDRKGSQKDAWNAGKIKMLLLHPKSGAHGLNLQHGGHIVINFDVYYSYGAFYQFLRRLARQGQKAEKVLVFNLLARNTYDVVVEKTCWNGKRETQEIFFELLKQVRKNLENARIKK